MHCNVQNKTKLKLSVEVLKKFFSVRNHHVQGSVWNKALGAKKTYFRSNVYVPDLSVLTTFWQVLFNKEPPTQSVPNPTPKTRKWCLIRAGNWAREDLSPDQQRYAVFDVMVIFVYFDSIYLTCCMTACCLGGSWHFARPESLPQWRILRRIQGCSGHEQGLLYRQRFDLGQAKLVSGTFRRVQTIQNPGKVALGRAQVLWEHLTTRLYELNSHAVSYCLCKCANFLFDV